MPYNEFGEYIPDELALDAMKYELAKKGVMPLRPGGSDVPYVASEIPQTYVAKPPPAPASTAKNVPQAIADRLGLSAIPQAALGMVSSFPAAVAKEVGFPKVAEAIQYTPTSKMGTEVLEGVSRLPQVLTGSEMGVGPLAEFYVPRRAFGLERRPFISPDDVRVMGSRAIESGRELRNIPEDFRAAQEGLRRESVFGGPTVGARAQGVAENIGDVMARRQMQGLSPIPGIPDIVPDTKLYAVRPPNVGQMIDPTDLPTARYVDENRAVQTVQNVIDDYIPMIDPNYPHNTKRDYYNAAVRDAPSEVLDAWKTFSQKKIEEMFPDAPSPADAVQAYEKKFDQRTFSLEQMNMLSEFAKSPEAQEAVNTFADRRDELINEYNKEKNKPKEKKPKNENELSAYEERRRAHEENVEKLELELLQKNLMPELSRDEFIKRITPPTLEEYMRRAKAAREYLEGTFKKDISKYIGTSQGPQMELAKRGVTLAPREELLEYARRLEADRGAFRGEFAEVQKARAKAGFNPKGEMFPLIEKKEAEVQKLQSELNELNRQKNELRDLHRIEMPDEPDPARNPGETGAKYRALTNPMRALIDKVEQSKKQLENFKLANAYELISDVAYTPVNAKQFKELIPYAEKQFFPNLAKTPDEAQMFNVKSRELGELGVPLLAEMIAKDILSGRIPLDETKPSALPKSKYKEDLSNFPEEDILDYAKAVRESKAAPKAKEEAEAAVLSGTSNKFIVYEGKRIAGAASYDIDESTKTVFIDHLGSLIKGTGKQMVQEIENAVPSGYRVVLTSSDQAVKFWDKLGYKPTGEGSLLEKRIEEPSQKVSKVNVQIDKIIEQLTKPRLKEESIKEAESRKGMVQLNEFAQETLSKIPANLRFKNASVLELTKDSTEDAIRRQISFDGMVLDHCIAGCDAPHPGKNPFSGESYEHSYPVDPATGKDRGGRKLMSGYMKRVKDGEERTSHLRDNVTGLPVVTINMNRNDNGTYRLSYVSGYRNKADKPQYAEDIKDYLNARSDIIAGSGDALQKWGIFDMMKNRDLSTVASMLRVPATESSITNLGLKRFVLEGEIRNLALQQPVGDTHADLVRRRAQLNDEYNRIVRDRGEDDPEAVDIADDIQDLTARLENMSRQATTVGNPNTFRRMTTEALTNELNQNGRGEVLAIYDNLINDDTYGLIDFWADDFDFYPERLRTFTNAVRNRQELVQAMTAGQEGYDAAMRESLIRFQDAIRNFSTQQRELLVRLLDEHAEVNIASQIDTLNPDDPEDSQRQYENAHPEVPDYLEEISLRRRGEDFTPEAAPAPQETRGANFITMADDIAGAENVSPFVRAELNNVPGIANEAFVRGEVAQQVVSVSQEFSFEYNPTTFIQALRERSRILDQGDPARRREMNLDSQREAGRLLGFLANSLERSAYSTVHRAHQHLIDAGDYRTLLNLANNLPNNRNGIYGQLTDEQRSELRSQLMDEIPRHLRPLQENAPRGDLPPSAYRDYYTSEGTGSSRAFDEIIEAERLTPGAIEQAIQRTNGRNAMFDPEVQEFYRIDVPAGISQLNHALHRYIEGRSMAVEAPQLPAPVVNPIDELERRYGQERAPIDIVTDGLNLPIPQFQRDYPENVQREYREILSEIEPAVSETNLQNAMHHLSVMHDIVLSQDREPAEFGLTSEQEKNQLADLLDRHFEVFRQFENLLDDQTQQYTPNFENLRIIETPRNQTVYHSTDADSPVISTRENRLIPNSLSASHSRSRVWGQNIFPISIPRGSRIGELNSIFDILPAGIEDTPINIGRQLRQYAQEQNLDVLKIRNVEGVGVEYVILNPNLLPNQRPEGRKRGGFIKMRKGGRPFRKENYPAPVEPEMQRPFDQELHDIFERLKSENTFDDGASLLEFQRKGSSSDQLGLAPRVFPRTPESDTSGQGHMDVQPDLYQPPARRYYNNGGRVNPVPTAARIESEAPKLPHIKPMVNPTDPGFAEKLKYEIEQRQKAAARTSGGGGNLTDTELKNRLGSRNPTYNAGGKVSIDQMRYELLRKR